MQNIIQKYYQTIIHFRNVQSFVDDIEVLEDAIVNYSYDYAVSVLSPLTYKYLKELNKLGEVLTGVVATEDTSLYDQKTDNDLLDDLFYLSRCIICFAALKLGIEPNYKSVADKIISQGLDLSNPDF